MSLVLLWSTLNLVGGKRSSFLIGRISLVALHAAPDFRSKMNENRLKTAGGRLLQRSLSCDRLSERQGCGVLSGMWARVRFGL